MLKKIFLLIFFNFLIIFPLQARDYDGEIAELKERIISLQNEALLGIRKFIPCSQILGYGVYVPLDKAEIRGSGELLIYVEPKNFFTKKNGEYYEIWLTEDMQVLDEQGNIIFNKPKALDAHFISKSITMDIFFHNSLNIEGLPPWKISV